MNLPYNATLNVTNEDGFGNEMPSALNAVNRMKCLFTNMKCYPMSDNIMNNPPVKLRLPPSFTQGGHRVSGNGFEVGDRPVSNNR